MQDLNKMSVGQLERLRTKAKSIIERKKRAAIPVAVIKELKKELKGFIRQEGSKTFNVVLKEEVRFEGVLMCEGNKFYITWKRPRVLGWYDVNQSALYRVRPDIAQELKSIQKEYNKFLGKTKRIAKEYEIKEDKLWDIIDDNNQWH